MIYTKERDRKGKIKKERQRKVKGGRKKRGGIEKQRKKTRNVYRSVIALRVCVDPISYKAILQMLNADNDSDVDPLSPRHDASSDFGYRRQALEMKCTWKYIEKLVADSRKAMVL
jgi:hypothetical protein